MRRASPPTSPHPTAAAAGGVTGTGPQAAEDDLAELAGAMSVSDPPLPGGAGSDTAAAAAAADSAAAADTRRQRDQQRKQRNNASAAQKRNTIKDNVACYKLLSGFPLFDHATAKADAFGEANKDDPKYCAISDNDEPDPGKLSKGDYEKAKRNQKRRRETRAEKLLAAKGAVLLEEAAGILHTPSSDFLTFSKTKEARMVAVSANEAFERANTRNWEGFSQTVKISENALGMIGG